MSAPQTLFSLPDSAESLGSLPDEGYTLLTRMQEYVMRIDILIKAADTRLDALQPIRTGRLRIEWWKGKGEGGLHGKRPYLVEWSYTQASGKWSAVIIHDRMPQKVKRSGLFKENADRVRETVMLIGDLLAARERASDAVARFKTSVGKTVQDNEALLVRCEGRLQEGMEEDAMCRMETT